MQGWKEEAARYDELKSIKTV